MKIGFDAKRAFFNTSGLGNYSRNLLNALITFFPQHHYYLYTPSGYKSTLYNPEAPAEIREPVRWWDRTFPALWRSGSIVRQITADKPDLYHGLSAELPISIEKTGIPSLVTIHDLIFLRYPALYSPADRMIYTRKAKNACRQATRIIAISKQTRDDLVEFLNINPERIDIVYQSCHPEYFLQTNSQRKKEVKSQYNLPDQYILYVGTIEERKNLLGLIQARERANMNIPLVVAGRPRKYAQKVREYIRNHRLRDVIFLNNIDVHDLPVLYQMASVFVYPSFFEGFGIPIIEALASGVPVITSVGGCFSEPGGPGTLYVNPHDPGEIGNALKKVLEDSKLREEMVKRGREHVTLFSPEQTARSMMHLYEKVLL